MSGKRMPTAVIQARGAKHLSRAETARRLAGELHPEPPKQIRCPEDLPETLRKDFLALGKELKELGIFCKLDYDTLTRYLTARQFWKQAGEEVAKALETGDGKEAERWSAIQDRFFKQCRNCANDLGLTVTSRCRLVVPEKEPEAEDNPFLKLLEVRRDA